MKKIFVLHPFLFAVSPILFLLSHNIEETSLEEIIQPSLIMILFVLFTQTLLTLIFYKPDYRLTGKKKIALILSLFFIIFFSYGHVFNSVEGLRVFGLVVGKRNYVLAFLILILLSGTYVLIRAKKNLSNLTTFLNIVSVSFVMISIGSIALYELRISDGSENIKGSIENSKEILINKNELPNIYYIILDGYAGSSTLKEEYNYDNQEFENYLTEKGFYIASESRSNYAETMLSLSSSLNMEHINTLGESIDLPMLHKMILENNVMKILKSKGYKIVSLRSSIGTIRRFPIADWDVRCGSFLANEFHQILIGSTILSRFKKYLNTFHFYRERILCTISTLGEIHHKVKKPSFIFCHFMLPHPPYMFGRNGEPTNEDLRFKGLWNKKKPYLDQLIFTNNMMKKVIKKILSEVKNEPIIIIQADHGPLITVGEETSVRTVNARMRIFNAFYLPKKDKNIFYSSITPVNTFRFIFNHYLNTNYELLEDKSYFTNYKMPYNFIDVTDKLLISDSILAKQLP